MRKLNNTIDFGRLVTELEEISQDQREEGQKELGMAKANHICKTAIALYTTGGRKAVKALLRETIVTTSKSGGVWLRPSQADRGCAIVIALVDRTKAGIFSRMWWNMRRLTK